MKKIPLIALLCLMATVAFVSCKKDKDEDSGSIIGKWYSKVAYTDVMYSGASIYKDTTTFTDGEYIEFKSDGTATSLDENGEVTTQPYSYNASAKTITMTYEDEPQTLTVKTLTSKEMVLTGSEQEKDEDSGLTVTANLEVHFSK